MPKPNSNPKILSVDFQKDFSAKGGAHYRPRPAVNFIKETIVPYLIKNKIKIAEIISDYRTMWPDSGKDSCAPGTWGYESEIDDRVKIKPIWVKCNNSPVWIRKNIGVANKKPGPAYSDPKKFKKWVGKVIGSPKSVGEIILIGLTADCCVFCTAQELCFMDYKVKILKEGTDAYSGSQKEKDMILKNFPLKNWASPITWKELKKKLIDKK